MALIGVTGGGGESWPPVKPQSGGALNRYEVEINGVQTTLLLSDADAKAQGLKPVDEKAKAAAANKSRNPANKSKRDEVVAKSMNKPSTKGDGA